MAIGVEGGFDSVSCSTAGDYPSVGVSQWEGDRCDTLLSYIDGGYKFSGRSYSDLESSGDLQGLKDLLDSEQGQAAQLQILASDAQDSYVPRLISAGLSDPRCIIYAGMWCPTSTFVVSRFVANRIDRIDSLESLRDIFRDEYAQAAEVPDNCYEGYQNRAESTYEYCSNLDLSEYGC